MRISTSPRRRRCKIAGLIVFVIMYFISFEYLGCCVLSTDCLQLLKTECCRSTCYYLYETNRFKTWDESSKTCSNKGQKMASIESEEVQKVIEILVQDIPNNKPRQIWIGGRRSTDTRWIYMNETEFDKTGIYRLF